MRSNRSASGNSCRSSQVVRSAHAALERLETRVFLSSSVLQYRYDNTSSGVNDAETQLTPTNVKVGSFGKLFTVPLDGQTYTEPLVQAGVTIGSGVNTVSGAGTVHNVVYVATENDTLYAIDSDGGQILWKRSFLSTSNTGGNINNTMGATSISVLTTTDVSVFDVQPIIGITSTPVIDSGTGLLYVNVKTKEVIGGKTFFVQRIHAIDVTDGTDGATPYMLGATTGGNINTTAIYSYGTGDGHVTDPYNGTGKQVIQFNALREFNRVALSIVNHQLYLGFASHGDNGPYHGWVVTLDVSKVTTSGFKLSGVLDTSPNDGEAGVWQAGGPITFDPNSNAFYFMTGNGTGGAPTVGANGFPTDNNYNEAVVKAVPDSTTSPTNQGPNGWGMKIVDYFIPFNVAAMDAGDSDFGSGAPAILPASAGIPGHPDLMVAGGKDGRVYVLDRDNLGHYHTTGDPDALNSVLNGSGHLTPPGVIGGTLITPTYYEGKVYLVSGYNAIAKAFTISSTGKLVTASQAPIGNFGYVPGGPIISSDGTNDGIVWMMDRNANKLHAFDANTLATELWNSGDVASDNVGAVQKFAEPTVINGKVYVGATSSLVVYGLNQAPKTAPKPPVLAATTLSGSSINLTWTDPSVAPNKASSYVIMESSNGGAFKQVATAASGATSTAIGGLQPLTTYSFQIAGLNSIGQSTSSNVAKATTTNKAAGIDFSGGFGSAAGQFTLNGKAALNAGNLELTDGKANEASSAFFNTPVDVTSFSTQFNFQLTAGAGTADGFTFTLQNSKLTALGSVGGGLGYGPVTAGGAIGITKSAMIKFDLYNNSGEGVDSTGLFENGVTPSGGGSINLAPSGIDLHSGDPFHVSLSYSGTTLTETITDTKTGKSATENYNVNLSTVIGSTTAFAGFTGGTGGAGVTQNILNWTYSPSASTSPNAPIGLGATPASATSVALTWTNAATNQTGYHLDRATDPDFKENLITETLPASPAGFTDTATGLAPGETFYYRLRAFNSAGDSGNSNVASIAIPLAPNTPTDAAITVVTTNEIDFTWTDNAGHNATGYNILRATNHGAFTVIANLPPTSRPAPSGYGYSDETATPGNFYEYHIDAVNESGNNDFAGVNATTLTAPPTKPAAAAGNGDVNLSWTAPAGAVSYNIYRGTTPGGEAATPIATGVTTTSYQDKLVTNGVKYYYKITAVNGNTIYEPPLPSESAPSAEVAATPSSGATTLPVGSLFTNSLAIGSPMKPGSDSYANGVYTVTGQGIDIWNASDQFRYVYKNVTGNTTIAATVTSVQNTFKWAKGAVMIRNGTAANAAFADIVVTPGGYLAFQWRTKAGGGCAQALLTGMKAPQTVKLVRTGNTFSAFYMVNGAWKQLGASVNIAMNAGVTTGLAVTSISSMASTATFTNVSVT